jgi:hypothetical protein
LQRALRAVGWRKGVDTHDVDAAVEAPLRLRAQGKAGCCWNEDVCRPLSGTRDEALRLVIRAPDAGLAREREDHITDDVVSLDVLGVHADASTGIRMVPKRVEQGGGAARAAPSLETGEGEPELAAQQREGKGRARGERPTAAIRHALEVSHGAVRRARSEDDSGLGRGVLRPHRRLSFSKLCRRPVQAQTMLPSRLGARV